MNNSDRYAIRIIGPFSWDSVLNRPFQKKYLNAYEKTLQPSLSFIVYTTEKKTQNGPQIENGSKLNIEVKKKKQWSINMLNNCVKLVSNK